MAAPTLSSCAYELGMIVSQNPNARECVEWTFSEEGLACVIVARFAEAQQQQHGSSSRQRPSIIRLAAMHQTQKLRLRIATVMHTTNLDRLLYLQRQAHESPMAPRSTSWFASCFHDLDLAPRPPGSLGFPSLPISTQPPSVFSAVPRAP